MSNSKNSSIIYGIHFPNKLFLGSLPPKATAEVINHRFSQYGKVIEAKVVLDNKGESKRYGFVTFSKVSEAEAVLKQENVLVFGQKVNVGPAIKKEGADYIPTAPVCIVNQTDIKKSKKSKGKPKKYRYKFVNKSVGSSDVDSGSPSLSPNASSPTLIPSPIYGSTLTSPSVHAPAMNPMPAYTPIMIPSAHTPQFNYNGEYIGHEYNFQPQISPTYYHMINSSPSYLPNDEPISPSIPLHVNTQFFNHLPFQHQQYEQQSQPLLLQQQQYFDAPHYSGYYCGMEPPNATTNAMNSSPPNNLQRVDSFQRKTLYVPSCH